MDTTVLCLCMSQVGSKHLGCNAVPELETISVYTEAYRKIDTSNVCEVHILFLKVTSSTLFYTLVGAVLYWVIQSHESLEA